MPTLAVTNVFSANTLIQSAQMNQNFDDVEAVVNALTSVNYAANSVNTAAIATAAVTSLKGGFGIDTSGSAQGGIAYLSATGTWSILTAGTAGQYLRTAGVSANPSWADDWNPQTLASTSNQTEAAGTATDIDFGATDTITVTVNGNQSIIIMFTCDYENSDPTGGADFLITDNANTTIQLGANSSPGIAVAAERQRITLFAHDTRPASGTKTYKLRFNRTVAGTVTIRDRVFEVFTFPDPA